MPPAALLVGQMATSLIGWSLMFAWVVWPALARLSRRDALLPLVIVQCFRHIGATMLAPGVAAATIPPEFAVPTAIGDTITVALALSAAVALRRRWKAAIALVWAMNVVGAVDMLHNAFNAARFEAAPHLGSQWFVVAVGVPMMAVVHVGIFVLLLRREP
jgi:hypothetical protein